MKILILALLLLALPPLAFGPARAATLVWSDNFDSYTAGGAPPSPWSSSGWVYVTTTTAHSSPNSLGAGHGGYNASVSRDLSAVGPAGYVDLWVYFPLPQWSALPVGVISTINCNNGPACFFHGNQHSPPAGYTEIQHWVNGAEVGDIAVSINVWHHFVLSFNAVNSPAGYSNIYMDGAPLLQYSGPVANLPSSFLVAGQNLGPSPDEEIYVDDVQAYSGCYAPDCVASSTNARAWIIQ